MNKYEKALEELSFPLMSSDCSGCKCGESDCSCEKREAVEALQELVDKATPKKTLTSKTLNLPYINMNVTFGKCPTCGITIAGKQGYCTKCGQAIDWEG